MGFSYKTDHGADVQDWFVDFLDGRGAGGGGRAGTGWSGTSGAGAAIGSAAALLLGIGKTKFPSLTFPSLPGETIPESPGLDLPSETIPESPEIIDTPGQTIPESPGLDLPSETIPESPGLDLPSETIPESPETNTPEKTQGFTLNFEWEHFVNYGKDWPEYSGIAPGVTQEDIDKYWPKYVFIDGKAYITVDKSKPRTKIEDVPNVNPEPETQTPITKEEETPVTDDTFLNLENVITEFDPLKWAENQQQKMWDREDEIRLETQKREDTAYQRAIEDMQRAGINPNLLGSITPAGSGGGIMNATPADTTLAQKQMEKDMELLKQTIEHAFKGDENQKDRVWSLIEKILGAGAMLGGAAIR